LVLEGGYDLQALTESSQAVASVLLGGGRPRPASAAARAMPEDAEGAARARSATEAFLYRRLDTLTETSGRFRLNVALPIPFDGFGSLEVDLLCADARLVIELDGGQHLADPVAYRRDRRKDQLLQENGYFVLRFLAEDVGKDLDAVLDAILKAPATKPPAFVGVDLGDQGYAVARIGKVLGRDPKVADAARAQREYAQAWGDAETRAYYAALKQRFKVDIKPAVLAATDPSGAASAVVK